MVLCFLSLAKSEEYFMRYLRFAGFGLMVAGFIILQQGIGSIAHAAHMPKCCCPAYEWPDNEPAEYCPIIPEIPDCNTDECDTTQQQLTWYDATCKPGQSDQECELRTSVNTDGLWVNEYYWECLLVAVPNLDCICEYYFVAVQRNHPSVQVCKTPPSDDCDPMNCGQTWGQ